MSNKRLTLEERLAKQVYIEGEVWKPVLGYEGDYEASDYGRVRRVETGLILSPGHSKQGQATVCLCVNGNTQQRSVHSLIAEAFLGKRPDGIVVNHINNNPRDNRLENLEYTTYQGNIRHAVIQGRMGKYKLQPDIVSEIAKAYDDISFSVDDIAERFGVTAAVVLRIGQGKSAMAQMLGHSKTQNVGLGGNRSKKLPIDNIRQIEQLLANGELMQKQIAELFGVDQSVISRIKYQTYVNRKPTREKKLRPEDVGNIRHLIELGENTQTEIAKMYEVSTSVISRIKLGQTYKKAA